MDVFGGWSFSTHMFSKVSTRALGIKPKTFQAVECLTSFTDEKRRVCLNGTHDDRAKERSRCPGRVVKPPEKPQANLSSFPDPLLCVTYCACSVWWLCFSETLTRLRFTYWGRDFTSEGLDFCPSLNSDFYFAQLAFSGMLSLCGNPPKNYRITLPRDPTGGKDSR